MIAAEQPPSVESLPKLRDQLQNLTRALTRVEQAIEGQATFGKPHAGLGAAPRDHLSFLRGADTLAPTALRVRRDRPSGGGVAGAGTVIPAAPQESDRNHRARNRLESGQVGRFGAPLRASLLRRAAIQAVERVLDLGLGLGR